MLLFDPVDRFYVTVATRLIFMYAAGDSYCQYRQGQMWLCKL